MVIQEPYAWFLRQLIRAVGRVAVDRRLRQNGWVVDPGVCVQWWWPGVCPIEPAMLFGEYVDVPLC